MYNISKQILYKNIRLCSTVSSKATIDANEVENFTRHASNWWDEYGVMKPLHSLNKLRIPFVRDGLLNTAINKGNKDTDEPLKGWKILDVGCGGGLVSEPLARLGAITTGLDATPSLLEIAKIHSRLDKKLANNLTYTAMSIEEFSNNNLGQFDAIVSSEVIEHVNEKDLFLESCVKCLKPGGSIFITTISQTLLSRILAIYAAENIFNLIPKGTHHFEKLICPHSLQRMLEDCNCTTRRIHGMFYNPLTNNWSWISNTDISYALQAVKNE